MIFYGGGGVAFRIKIKSTRLYFYTEVKETSFYLVLFVVSGELLLVVGLIHLFVVRPGGARGSGSPASPGGGAAAVPAAHPALPARLHPALQPAALPLQPVTRQIRHRFQMWYIPKIRSKVRLGVQHGRQLRENHKSGS